MQFPLIIEQHLVITKPCALLTIELTMPSCWDNFAPKMWKVASSEPPAATRSSGVRHIWRDPGPADPFKMVVVVDKLVFEESIASPVDWPFCCFMADRGTVEWTVMSSVWGDSLVTPDWLKLPNSCCPVPSSIRSTVALGIGWDCWGSRATCSRCSLISLKGIIAWSSSRITISKLGGDGRGISIQEGERSCTFYAVSINVAK